MSIILKIKKRIVDYSKNNENSPNKLYLTTTDENSFFVCSEELGSELLADVTINGFRKAIEDRGNKYLGLEVIWGSDEFKVTYEE